MEDLPCETCPTFVMCYNKVSIKCPILLKWIREYEPGPQWLKGQLLADKYDCERMELAVDEFYRVEYEEYEYD